MHAHRRTREVYCNCMLVNAPCIRASLLLSIASKLPHLRYAAMLTSVRALVVNSVTTRFVAAVAIARNEFAEFPSPRYLT